MKDLEKHGSPPVSQRARPILYRKRDKGIRGARNDGYLEDPLDRRAARIESSQRLDQARQLVGGLALIGVLSTRRLHPGCQPPRSG